MKHIIRILRHIFFIVTSLLVLFSWGSQAQTTVIAPGVTFNPTSNVIQLLTTKTILGVRVGSNPTPLPMEYSIGYVLCGDSPSTANLYNVVLPISLRNGQQLSFSIDFEQSGTPYGCNIDSDQFSFAPPTQAFGHVQHLSYYYGVYNGGQQYLSEFRGHSNTAWVVPFSATDLVNLMNSLGGAQPMKAIVSLEPTAFSFSQWNVGCTLYPNWQSRVTALLQAVDPYVIAGRVAAFYPIDEPHPTCIQQTQQVIAFVKATYPNIPHATIFSTLNGTNLWPNNVDWVGFDEYGNCTSNPVEHFNFRILPQFYNMKNRLTSSQRLMVVTDGYWPCSASNGWAGGGTPDDYTTINADLYLSLAADPSVIAVVPFIWQDGGASRPLAIRDLPKTRARYVDFGTNRTNLPR